jgi:hypothetical protein
VRSFAFLYIFVIAYTWLVHKSGIPQKEPIGEIDEFTHLSAELKIENMRYRQIIDISVGSMSFWNHVLFFVMCLSYCHIRLQILRIDVCTIK